MGSRRRSLGGALLALALPTLAAAAPETWRVDPVHSQVWFSVSHQGFSYPQGRLRIERGWFQFDPKDWSASRVDVTIDLAAADMGDTKWSETVTSGQFLDTARWPSARFYSLSVSQTDATHGVIHGQLLFRGQARPLDVDVTLNQVANDPYAFAMKAGFSAQARLQRSAFGMKRFASVVGDLVTVHCEIEGVRDRNAAGPEPAKPATDKN